MFSHLSMFRASASASAPNRIKQLVAIRSINYALLVQNLVAPTNWMHGIKCVILVSIGSQRITSIVCTCSIFVVIDAAAVVVVVFTSYFSIFNDHQSWSLSNPWAIRTLASHHIFYTNIKLLFTNHSNASNCECQMRFGSSPPFDLGICACDIQKEQHKIGTTVLPVVSRFNRFLSCKLNIVYIIRDEIDIFMFRCSNFKSNICGEFSMRFTTVLRWEKMGLCVQVFFTPTILVPILLNCIVILRWLENEREKERKRHLADCISQLLRAD